MFGRVRNKKSQADALADELTSQTAECVEKIKAKWVYFNKTVKSKEGVPLWVMIELFAKPVQEFVEKYYPLLLTGPIFHFWMMIFTAILESGTHPRETVNQAIAELEKKYAR